MTTRFNMELYDYINSQKLDGESFEKCIVRLLKAYPVTNYSQEREIGVCLSKEARDFIKEYRITQGESVVNILTRLFLKK